ncbi:MAG TPA: universal stress protein [Casimicrobiaceae bacterium]|nr:universal stress protein [Casimicrobiaceae bacterium]
MIRVLLPVDGSDSSARAVQRVASCSQRVAPVEVQLLYVQVDDGTAATVFDEPARNDALEAGNRALQSAADVLARAGVACMSESRKGFVPSVIVEHAKSTNCDAIVMGTRGMGSTQQLLGSIARQVISLSDLPVTLVK